MLNMRFESRIPNFRVLGLSAAFLLVSSFNAQAAQTCWEGSWKSSESSFYGKVDGEGSGVFRIPALNELTKQVTDGAWLSFHYTWKDSAGSHVTDDRSTKLTAALISDDLMVDSYNGTLALALSFRFPRRDGISENRLSYTLDIQNFNRASGAGEFKRVPCPGGSGGGPTPNGPVGPARPPAAGSGNVTSNRLSGQTLSLDAIGSSLKGLVTETKERCPSGLWVDGEYRITADGMTQLWVESSGWFYVGNEDGTPNPEGSYLTIESRKAYPIYYGLSGVLNSYVGPSERKVGYPLAIYRTKGDTRPIVIRVAYCKR
jgi:hypothetical protein